MSPVIVIVTLVAGGLGALARYGVTRLVSRSFPPEKLPRAVLIVNVAGSFLAGTMLGLAPTSELRYVLLSGLAAGLTTFSTWTVETVQLALGGRARAAVLNVVANLIWGLAAALLGVVLVTWIAYAGVLVNAL